MYSYIKRDQNPRGDISRSELGYYHRNLSSIVINSMLLFFKEVNITCIIILCVYKT